MVLGEKKMKEKGKDEEKLDKKPKDEVQSKWKKSKKTRSQNVLPSTMDESKIGVNDGGTEKEEEPPFSSIIFDLRFRRELSLQLWVVGKSSLLQAMIG